MSSESSCADIKTKDIFGETALDIARRYGNHHVIKQILRLSWLQRCKSSKPQYSNIPLRAFQMCDSAYPKWRRNLNGQIYLQVSTSIAIKLMILVILFFKSSLI
ncbi:uncharacterized protein DC041_0012605 [Schistosoma bovis]|uniref:Uncharacterized protein n=1 Tax=Schistosoma bovis TaxID=6184 RepID=A0A430Q869_SCHBO|nr:uncharacterized protein DC041_0012605 [Schistosoma bovis]